MSNYIPILHVDGSLTEYVDKKGILHQVAGVGGYLVINGKIVDKFEKHFKDIPYLNHHEEYAILEGLKWVKDKKIKVVKVKSDSLSSVSLFTHHKKTVNKIDKFFLLQFLLLELEFENINIVYHQRSDDDLSHCLSRTYMKDLPKDIVKLHCENHKKKVEYNIIASAAQKCEQEIRKVLHTNLKEMLPFR